MLAEVARQNGGIYAVSATCGRPDDEVDPLAGVESLHRRIVGKARTGGSCHDCQG